MKRFSVYDGSGANLEQTVAVTEWKIRAMGNSSDPFWYLTSFRNNFTTSPVAIQDLPHDYSRSQLMNGPVIEDSDFIAYLWAVVIHVITSASITFTAAAAGGPGSTTTPIVNVGLLSQLGHMFIGLIKGQGNIHER